MGGIFKKKSKTVENSTMQRTNPEWTTLPQQGLTSDIGNLSGTDPMSLFAGADPLQTQASQGAAGLGAMVAPQFANAIDMSRFAGEAGPVTGTAASVLDDGLDKYMSPYTRDVVDTTMADMDVDAGRTRAQLDLDLTRSGAFGGSGAGIAKGSTEEGLHRARGGAVANLRDAAYRFGGQMAESDAGRRQQMNVANMNASEQALMRRMQGGSQLAQIAQMFGGDQRANIDAQARLGTMNRQIEADKRLAPIDLLKLRTQLLAGQGFERFGGQQSNGTSTTTTTDPLGAISKIAATAALFAKSDIRLKTDIERIGTRPDGLGVYLYRYLWSPQRFIGVMAQEVAKLKPWAVARMQNGYLAVDYGAL